jgi:hypothetical protein
MRPVVLTLVLACSPVIAGCGGSAPTRDPAQEARVVSETNEYCRHLDSLPRASRLSQEQNSIIQARLAAYLREIAKTAAYLPAGRDLNEAHAARRALFLESSRRVKAGLGRPADFNVRVDRLQLRIYADELALGLTCAGAVAREDRRTDDRLAKASP